ncbi:MAG: hypothetical protein ATN36_06810 [Epulopiscium sp. Nele67-Bin005]|nr:MAG: hypothetical protein ATN36_06810 [Epulopiscium sp. Nele67-Bin005]
MFCKLINYTLKGLSPLEIQVEVDLNNGLPAFDIVGLPDSSVKESKERVRSAIKNSGFTFPISRITVNLAPANVKKEGSLYDLPIALAILACSGIVPLEKLNNFICFGELALDGKLRSFKQLFPILCTLYNLPHLNEHYFIVPSSAKPQLSALNSKNILYADNLLDIVKFFSQGSPLEENQYIENLQLKQADYPDFMHIYGQECAKHALLTAACGNHNVLLIGPPGSGKTLLSRSFPALFPPLSLEEAIELTQIYSLADLAPQNELLTNRPFRSPHHTITAQALCGGGSNPKPGEITLSHLGILFLDELLEFNKKTLEILRQPLESKNITISRAQQNVTYPADFLLIASTNPCPCGYYPDTRKCNCSMPLVKKYLQKLSGPLLDRIDLHIETKAVNSLQLQQKKSLSTHEMIESLQIGNERQRHRFKHKSNFYNSHMSAVEINEFCTLTKTAEMLLNTWFETSPHSMRSYHKILKLSRTIADIEDFDIIQDSHIAQAIQYRSLDHSFWE